MTRTVVELSLEVRWPFWGWLSEGSVHKIYCSRTFFFMYGFEYFFLIEIPYCYHLIFCFNKRSGLHTHACRLSIELGTLVTTNDYETNTTFRFKPNKEYTIYFPWLQSIIYIYTLYIYRENFYPKNHVNKLYSHQYPCKMTHFHIFYSFQKYWNLFFVWDIKDQYKRYVYWKTFGSIHSEKSFRNLVNPNWIWIVIKLFR